jgi:methionyl-tRNA formyltransferase
MRVIVLTSGPYGTASRCVPVLAESAQIEIAAVVMAEDGASPHPFRARMRKLKKLLRVGILGGLNGIRMRPWYEGDPSEHIETLCKRLNIPFYRSAGLNSDQTAAIFKMANVDLGLSLGNRYISKRIFSIPRLGMINVHGELLPEYRNAQGVMWNIYNRETMTGYTVHEIDDKIDTGRIFFREKFPIQFHRSLKETISQTMKHTFNRIPYGVRYVCENYEELSRQAKPQPSGNSYTTPSFAAFLTMVRNNRKLFRASGQAASQ